MNKKLLLAAFGGLTVVLGVIAAIQTYGTYNPSAPETAKPGTSTCTPCSPVRSGR